VASSRPREELLRGRCSSDRWFFFRASDAWAGEDLWMFLLQYTVYAIILFIKMLQKTGVKGLQQLRNLHNSQHHGSVEDYFLSLSASEANYDNEQRLFQPLKLFFSIMR